MQVHFMRGGELVFSGDVIVGTVGVGTGVSRKGFSISINERNLGGAIFNDGINALLKKSKCPSLLCREVSGSLLHALERNQPCVL
jgi:hypothetical protein